MYKINGYPFLGSDAFINLRVEDVSDRSKGSAEERH